MSKNVPRSTYEHLEPEVDGSWFWETNSNVKRPYGVPELEPFLKWWKENEENNGVYYIGTHLYFTFKGEKYDVSWTFYDEDYLKEATKKLKALGATDILLNYGRLD